MTLTSAPSSPAIGCSLSAVTYSLISPASQNGYGYVHGNPANFTDPTGMLPDCQGLIES